MSSFFRKVERNSMKKQHEAYKRQLVKEGKKAVIELEGGKPVLKIVDAKKPYRKEKK